MIGENTITDGGSDFSIVREVASLLIFTQQSERAALAYKEILSLFTGELLTTPSQQQGQGQALPISLSSSSSLPPEDTADSLSHVEKLLWTILTGDDRCASECAAPSKAGAALCLRYYRRVLNAAGWRAGGKQPGNSLLMEFAGIQSHQAADSFCDTEMDELLALIHLMSVLCRAVVLAYTALEKKTKSNECDMELISFSKLLRSLPPGTKSDVANSILEALEHCVGGWRKRFDRSWVLAGQNQLFVTGAAADGIRAAGLGVEENQYTLKLYAQSQRSPAAFADAFAREGRRKLLSHETPPVVPATAAFMTISESLPVPKTFNDVFSRLFG